MYWRILPVAPTTAFSPSSPVQKADFERVPRVDLTRSPRWRGMTAICVEAASRIDVNLPLQIATLDASIGRRAPYKGRLGKDRSSGQSRHSFASAK